MTAFRDDLTKLILEHTNGKTMATGLPEGKTGEIVADMIEQLAKFIALSCNGDAIAMNKFLEGASSYMFEIAAETAPMGKLMGTAANWNAPK